MAIFCEVIWEKELFASIPQMKTQDNSVDLTSWLNLFKSADLY